MSDIEIRPASVADAAGLADVYRSAYRENRELGFPAKAELATPETVTAWIEDARVFVAVSDGRVVGGVRLEVTGPDRVKLSRLGVRESAQGRGIGRRLLAHAEDWVRSSPYNTVWLTTPPDHPYLPDWYRRRGYEQTADYPLDDREYDEVVFEKRVA